jgi:hypothetical protein
MLYTIIYTIIYKNYILIHTSIYIYLFLLRSLLIVPNCCVIQNGLYLKFSSKRASDRELPLEDVVLKSDTEAQLRETRALICTKLRQIAINCVTHQ